MGNKTLAVDASIWIYHVSSAPAPALPPCRGPARSLRPSLPAAAISSLHASSARISVAAASRAPARPPPARASGSAATFLLLSSCSPNGMHCRAVRAVHQGNARLRRGNDAQCAHPRLLPQARAPRCAARAFAACVCLHWLGLSDAKLGAVPRASLACLLTQMSFFPCSLRSLSLSPCLPLSLAPSLPLSLSLSLPLSLSLSLPLSRSPALPLFLSPHLSLSLSLSLPPPWTGSASCST